MNKYKKECQICAIIINYKDFKPREAIYFIDGT